MTATLSKTELWQLIHDQRRRVADVLETLSDDQWNAASLCTGWRVRDVAAHNIETFLMTPPRFIGRFVGAGFNFDRMTGRGVDNHRDEPLTRLLAQYRDTEDRSTAPPGPQLAWLGEAVIHGEDGLDEISTTTSTTVFQVEGGRVQKGRWSPADFGLPEVSLEDLAGGDAATNADIIRSVLNGDAGPRRDIVVANAAAALLVAQQALDLKSAVAAAIESIESGAARRKLEALGEFTASIKP